MDLPSVETTRKGIEAKLNINNPKQNSTIAQLTADIAECSYSQNDASRKIKSVVILKKAEKERNKVDLDASDDEVKVTASSVDRSLFQEFKEFERRYQPEKDKYRNTKSNRGFVKRRKLQYPYDNFEVTIPRF